MLFFVALSTSTDAIALKSLGHHPRRKSGKPNAPNPLSSMFRALEKHCFSSKYVHRGIAMNTPTKRDKIPLHQFCWNVLSGVYPKDKNPRMEPIVAHTVKYKNSSGLKGIILLPYAKGYYRKS